MSSVDKELGAQAIERASAEELFVFVPRHQAEGMALTGDPGRVWRVGFEPDMWAWTPWRYATDDGLFNGRWDDQLGQFRTLYTSDSLRGCFLEILAKLQPSSRLSAELDAFEDDDGSVAIHT